MARVTVEDCIEKVKDRFELVAVAAQRARNVQAGDPLTIERKGEKNTVISLREIALGSVKVDHLREDLVTGYMHQRNMDEDVHEELAVDISRLEDVQELEAAEEELPEGEFEEEAEEEAALDAAEEEELINKLADDLGDEGDYSFEDENVDEND